MRSMFCRLGIGGEKVEVRFEELAVEAQVRIGRRAPPTLLNCVLNAAQVRRYPLGAGASVRAR